MPSFVIEILPDGNIKIEASGFTGGKCLETARPLLDALTNNPKIEQTLEYSAVTQEEQQW